MRIIYSISFLVFGTLFEWLGAIIFDKGNWLGGWSLLLGTIGSIIGIVIGYRINKYYF